MGKRAQGLVGGRWSYLQKPQSGDLGKTTQEKQPG